MKLVITDFDGVMTDNRVFVFDDGHEAVVCNRADGVGCSLLRAAGIEVMILSTETSAVVETRAKKLGVEAIAASPDKRVALDSICADRRIDPGMVAFIGNDVNDLEAMRRVRWPVAPADAHQSVRNVARIVTKAHGGEGVLRELADLLLGRSP